MVRKRIFLEIMNYFIHPEYKLRLVNEIQTGDIKDLLSFSLIHSVYPITYEVVRNSEAFFAFPQETRLEYKYKTRQLVIGQASRTSLFLQFYDAILQAGIHPIVVKGIVLRNLYKWPDYRASMDEDLLVLHDEYYELDKILKQLGFECAVYEEPLKEHEITYFHNKYGMHLEVHLSLFPENSEAYGRLNREFSHVFDRKVTVEIGGISIYTLSPTDHMLYLLCHGLKHFVHSGFGIRQVCDMILFAETYGEQIDWEKIIRRTKAQHMYRFWMNLFDIGERYLGFDWNKAHLRKPEDMTMDSKALLNDLLESGVYGKSSNNRLHSANITLQALENGKEKLQMTKTLFPDWEYMSRNYPYLKKHPWMLPAAWVQRGMTYMRQSKSGNASRSMDIGKKRVDLMRHYGIIDSGHQRKK